MSESDEDPLYETAKLVVEKTGRACTTNLQRQLLIGYNRAYRLLEAMQIKGVVSEVLADGSRQVLTNNKGNEARNV